MAALPETPFTLLLRADSEHPLPDSDPDVIAALNAYGALFNKAKKHVAARLDLLAGLVWVRVQLDLHTVLSAASVAQHRILAAALRLDYDTHAASAPWRTMVVRKVLSCSVPGSTPQKRKAPDSSVDGQIKVPRNRDEARAPSPVGKKKRKSTAGAKPPKDSSSSSGDDSSSSSAHCRNFDCFTIVAIVELTTYNARHSCGDHWQRRLMLTSYAGMAIMKMLELGLPRFG